MQKIIRIKIEGFRRLHHVEFDMRPIMVMIGANSVGNTSLLDALSLLSASTTGTLNRRLGETGSVADIITRGRDTDISLSVEIEVPGNEPLKYDLYIEPRGQAHGISQETLSQQRAGFDAPFKHIDSHYNDIRYSDTEIRGFERPNWEHNLLESTLAQAPKMFRQTEELRRTLGSMAQYHVLDVGLRAPVKLPQQLLPADLPGENGEILVPFLCNLREENRAHYEPIEDTLKSTFPGVEALNIPSVAAGMLSMTWKEKSFRTPIYTH